MASAHSPWKLDEVWGRSKLEITYEVFAGGGVRMERDEKHVLQGLLVLKKLCLLVAETLKKEKKEKMLHSIARRSQAIETFGL